MKVINNENMCDLLLLTPGTTVLWSRKAVFYWPYSIERIESPVLLCDHRIEYTSSWCNLAHVYVHTRDNLTVGHGPTFAPVDIICQHTIYVVESMEEIMGIIPVHLMIHNAEKIRLLFERYISNEKDHQRG